MKSAQKAAANIFLTNLNDFGVFTLGSAKKISKYSPSPLDSPADSGSSFLLSLSFLPSLSLDDGLSDSELLDSEFSESFDSGLDSESFASESFDSGLSESSFGLLLLLSSELGVLLLLSDELSPLLFDGDSSSELLAGDSSLSFAGDSSLSFDGDSSLSLEGDSSLSVDGYSSLSPVEGVSSEELGDSVG